MLLKKQGSLTNGKNVYLDLKAYIHCPGGWSFLTVFLSFPGLTLGQTKTMFLTWAGRVNNSFDIFCLTRKVQFHSHGFYLHRSIMADP